MSDMKCPVCKGELHIFKSSTQDAIVCADCGFDGNTKLWQELIRTRKALDLAKSKLNGIHRLYSKAFYTREDWLQVCMEMVDKANTALEQITALKQKDK